MSKLKKFKVTLEWRAIVLVLIFLPVTLSLGFWQLDRAEQKRQLQSIFDQRRNSVPVAIESLAADADLRYQPVYLQGNFLTGKNIFLDNRISKGRFGYEVVTPFLLTDQNVIVLINRGWVAGDKSRRTLPKIDAQEQIVTITGEVYVPVGKMISLAPEQDNDWPRVRQTLNIDEMQKEFSRKLFPYSIRLDENSSGAFEPNWMVVNLTPERHTGYAVQWFAMSFALLVILVLANSNLWRLITGKEG